MKVPPMPQTPPRGFDTFTEAGAKQLVKTIEAAWAAKGHKVKADYQRIPCMVREDGTRTKAYFLITSNLINGLPPKEARQ